MTMRTLALLAILSLFLGVQTARSGGAQSPRISSKGAAVIREMNLARQHPARYARFLEELRPQYQGRNLVLPGRRVIRTREGVAAVNEAIRFLRRTRPLPPLIASPGIARAAAEHVAEQADGSMGHRGSNFSDAGERLNRHGTWQMRWGENIAYGKSSARSIVLALIIDDGLRGREHRNNIFNAAFRYTGAAVGPHARYRTVCSIDFAGGYVEAGSRSLLARN